MVEQRIKNLDQRDTSCQASIDKVVKPGGDFHPTHCINLILEKSACFCIIFCRLAISLSLEHSAEIVIFGEIVM